ncbi:MAG: DUF4190 domain-containing protein [Verrucomicrobiota bacterium]|jgi:hypothetical protein
MYKIIGADQKEYGPITADQVRQWIHEGRLNATSRIQVEGAGEWKLLRELPEFAANLLLLPSLVTYQAAPAVPTTNVMAGWALATGIFAFCCCCLSFIVGPVSIVLGVMALSQIRQNPNQDGRGMAIAGIILGVFSLLLFVVAMLIYLLSPEMVTNLQNRFPN